LGAGKNRISILICSLIGDGLFTVDLGDMNTVVAVVSKSVIAVMRGGEAILDTELILVRRADNY